MAEIMKPRGVYGFEETVLELGTASGIKDLPRRELVSWRKTFLQNLGVDPGEKNDKSERLLVRLLEVVHVSAWWFNQRMASAYRIRWFWFCFSLGILLGIVALAWYPPSNSNGREVTQISAQITLVLTGLVLVFKTLNSWVSARGDISNYWQGRSDLLDLLYDFETKWRSAGRDKIFSGDTVTAEFEKDLVDLINQAQDKTRLAMDGIITSLQAPSVSLDELTAAQTKASTLFNSLFKSSLNTNEELVRERTTRRDLVRAIEALKSAIAEGEGQLRKMDRERIEIKRELDQKGEDDAASRMVTRIESKIEKLEADLNNWTSALRNKKKDLLEMASGA